MLRLAVVAVLFSGACAGSQPSPQRAEPQPAAETEPQPEAPAVPVVESGMTLEEADGIVSRFVARHGQPDPEEPLLHPKSLDEVLEILGRDQLDLFAAGAAFAASQAGLRAKALHAQIELSWGDACMVLADILRENAARARPQKHKLEQRAAELGEAEKAELAERREMIEEGVKTARALMTIADTHFETGSQLAQEVIAANPDDYAGYRVAADYYRLGQDWEKFAAMVEKIEAAKPKSIGLTFLRGVAAADRDNDRQEAARLLREALAGDPGFTRAQAMLVVWAGSVGDMFAEYEKLEALNPKHQIVVWAGAQIERAHEAWKAKQP